MDEFEFARSVTIGQYVPGSSVVHRIDPRAKLIAFVVIIAAVILARGPRERRPPLFVWAVPVLTIALVLHGAMYGPQAAFITELFPTRIRYSGVSIAYQLTSIVAGSLAPIIALWLYTEYDSAVPVAIYVGVACVISGVSGAWSGANPVPASFSLNGTVCTGSVSTPTASPTSASPSPTATTR